MAASRQDVIDILGALDDDKLLAILELRPNIADLEQAHVWLSGDRDVFGATPIKGTASSIVTILTVDEEDEPGAPAA